MFARNSAPSAATDRFVTGSSSRARRIVGTRAAGVDGAMTTPSAATATRRRVRRRASSAVPSERARVRTATRSTERRRDGAERARTRALEARRPRDATRRERRDATGDSPGC